MNRFQRGGLLAGMLGAGLALACSETRELSTARTPPPDTLVARVGGQRLSVAASITAGWRPFRLEETDSAGHNASVFLLRDGISVEQFVAELDSLPNTPASGVALGGPDGASTEVLLHLPPGRLLVACLLRGADGARHVGQGEWGLVESRASNGPADSIATPGREAVQVDLLDFAFGGSTQWPPGTRAIEVRNLGRQDHVLLLARLHPGRTLGDWFKADEPEKVGVQVGGVARLSPGQRAYLPVALVPGKYVLYCLVVDRATKRMHLELGMVREIRVGNSD